MAHPTDGKYTIRMTSNLGWTGDGFAEFNNLKVFGGDALFEYGGKLSDDGGYLKGVVTVRVHASGFAHVFGNHDQFKVFLSGRCVRGVIHLRGSVKGRPELGVVVEMKRTTAMVA